MNFQLVSALARGAWAMEGSYASTFLDILFANKSGTPTAFYNLDAKENEKINSSYVLYAEGEGLGQSEQNAPEGSVFVTALSGAVMKNSNCGVAGTAEMAAELAKADRSNNIIAHIISVDSGGGSVNGLEEFSQAVQSLNKPVYGFIDGCACSAGYYMLAHCTEIFMSSKAAMTGSIGTMMGFLNYSNSKEVLGFEEVIINANLSPDKNAAYIAAREGNETPMKAELDAYALQFQNAVRSGRPEVKEAALTGKTFQALEAIDMGLVDGIKSLEEIASTILNNHKNTAA